MNSTALFASQQHDWRTPVSVLTLCAERAGGPFDLDVAADASNAVCARWFGPGSPHAPDALTVAWSAQRVWMNPPYGRALPRFTAKAVEEVAARRAGEVWMLVPARTDTRWWQQAVSSASDVWFVRGRIRFARPGESHGVAPFPSAVLRLVAGANTPRVQFGVSLRSEESGE